MEQLARKVTFTLKLLMLITTIVGKERTTRNSDYDSVFLNTKNG